MGDLEVDFSDGLGYIEKGETISSSSSCSSSLMCLFRMSLEN